MFVDRKECSTNRVRGEVMQEWWSKLEQTNRRSLVRSQTSQRSPPVLPRRIWRVWEGGLFAHNRGLSYRLVNRCRRGEGDRRGNFTHQLSVDVNELLQAVQIAILVVTRHPRLVVVYLHAGGQNPRFAKINHPDIRLARLIMDKQQWRADKLNGKKMFIKINERK